ncbi:hypothetical protein D018_0283 [Vibrio parahaemolyticus VP2007-007]|nr:hypothetical protein D018_0283 [Vibrio parahaemolyticus VP2007-007]
MFFILDEGHQYSNTQIEAIHDDVHQSGKNDDREPNHG